MANRTYPIYLSDAALHLLNFVFSSTHVNYDIWVFLGFLLYSKYKSDSFHFLRFLYNTSAGATTAIY